MYKTILVCDDVVYSRTIIVDILQSLGEFIVIEKEGGKEAVNTYFQHMRKKNEIDLVFLDIEMKKINGMETLRYLKELDPSCKVVMCGTRLSDELLLEALELGVTQFLTKPYKKHEVEMILKELKFL